MVVQSAFCTSTGQVEMHWNSVHSALMSETKPEQAVRLEQARIDRGFKSPREATNFFGWSYDSYIQHENGLRGLTRSAEKYAKAFRVSTAWLLTGEGLQTAGARLRIAGYVGAGAVIYPMEDGEDMLEEVELDFPMPNGTVAAIVRGDSMMPVFEDGDLIGYYRDGIDPQTILNRTCVVKVLNGPTYIKTLKRGSSEGLYTLTSFNATDIEDVSVEWAAPFQFRVSRFQWRTL